MRTEKNIILIRHAKWLWDNKLKKQSKELVHMKTIILGPPGTKNNNVIKFSRSIYTRRN